MTSRALQRIGADPVMLVSAALGRGWIKPPAPPVKSQVRGSDRRREAFRAQGLTLRGTPRVRKQWPQLKGLKGKMYGIAYNRLQRGRGLESPVREYVRHPELAGLPKAEYRRALKRYYRRKSSQ